MGNFILKPTSFFFFLFCYKASEPSTINILILSRSADRVSFCLDIILAETKGIALYGIFTLHGTNWLFSNGTY